MNKSFYLKKCDLFPPIFTFLFTFLIPTTFFFFFFPASNQSTQDLVSQWTPNLAKPTYVSAPFTFVNE